MSAIARITGVLSLFAILVSCGGSGGESGGPSSNDTGGTTGANEFNSVTLTPSGGTFEFGNGVSIEVPAGAVNEDVVLKARLLDSTEVQSIFDKNQGANHKQFLAGIDLEPKGFKFSQPVNLIVPADRPLSPTELPLPYIVDHEHQISTLDTSFVSSPPLLKAETSSANSANKLDPYPTKYVKADCVNNRFVLVGVSSLPPEQRSTVIAAVDEMRQHLGEACKACEFDIEVREWDYIDEDASNSLNTCINVGSVGRVTYHQCPGSPTETWDLSEKSIGRILLNPDHVELGQGDSTPVDSIVLDAADHVITRYTIQDTVDRHLKSNDESVATVQKNSNDVNWFWVSGQQPGTTTVTVPYRCNLEATLPVEVIDFAVTPSNLCVEKYKTADFNVIAYSEAVNLSDIRWSSSDITVATVDESSGRVSASGVGPAKIIAETNVYVNGVIEHLEASATVEVKESCVSIKPVDKGLGALCIEAPSSPLFDPLDNTTDLEIVISTPQQRSIIYWDSLDMQVATVESKDEFTSTVTAVSSGSAEIQVTVDNIVTQYTSSIPVAIKEIPDDYSSAWLTIPGDQTPFLTHNRDVLSEAQYSEYILEAEEKCNVNLDPNNTGPVSYTGVNRKMQLIGSGNLPYGTDEINGFIFDTATCELEIIDPPWPALLPRGNMANYNHIYPMAINDAGTVVGYAYFAAYDEENGRGSYEFRTAFIYDHGAHSFPSLVPLGLDDFYAINDHYLIETGFDDINNSGYALFYEGRYNWSYYLYNTKTLDTILIDSAQPSREWTVVNDYNRVLAPGFNQIFSNNNIINVPINFSSAPATLPILYDINNADDILAEDHFFRPVVGGSYDPAINRKFFVNYLCPFPIESGTALWMEDSTLLEGYEETELSCDGRNNDLDQGGIDNGLEAPLTTKQAGVCAGARKVCRGAQGWVDDYSKVPDYKFPETAESCDGKDNDCDGEPDEFCN